MNAHDRSPNNEPKRNATPAYLTDLELTSHYVAMKEAVARVSSDMGEIEARRFVRQIGPKADAWAEGLYVWGEGPLAEFVAAEGSRAEHLFAAQAQAALRAIVARCALTLPQWSTLAGLTVQAYQNVSHPSSSNPNVEPHISSAKMSAPVRVKSRYVHAVGSLVLSILRRMGSVRKERSLRLAKKFLDDLLKTFEARDDLRTRIQLQIQTLSQVGLKRADGTHNGFNETDSLLSGYLQAIQQCLDKLPRRVNAESGLVASRYLQAVVSEMTRREAALINQDCGYFFSDWSRLVLCGLTNQGGHSGLSYNPVAASTTNALSFQTPVGQTVEFRCVLHYEKGQQFASCRLTLNNKTSSSSGYAQAREWIDELDELSRSLTDRQNQSDSAELDLYPDSKNGEATKGMAYEIAGTRRIVFQVCLSGMEPLVLDEPEALALLNAYNQWKSDANTQIVLRRARKLYGDI